MFSNIMFDSILFYSFATILVLFSLAVIYLKNPIYNILSLIIVFFNAACLFILLRAEFLAMLLIIVYVGTVVVLFLFVIMTLQVDRDKIESEKNHRFYRIVGIFTLIELIAIMYKSYQNVFSKTNLANIYESDNIRTIGQILYTDYIYLFQVMGVVLFIAMVGAIVLAFEKSNGTLKTQNISEQISHNYKNSIELVNQPIGKGVEPIYFNRK